MHLRNPYQQKTIEDFYEAKQMRVQYCSQDTLPNAILINYSLISNLGMYRPPSVSQIHLYYCSPEYLQPQGHK